MKVAKVAVSPEFQIVIPKEIREELDIKPGQILLLRTIDGRIQMSPPRPVAEIRGIANGIQWPPGLRDHTERF